MDYEKLIAKIRESNDPFEILSSVDNIKFLNEKSIRKRNKQLKRVNQKCIKS